MSQTFTLSEPAVIEAYYCGIATFPLDPPVTLAAGAYRVEIDGDSISFEPLDGDL